MDDFDSRVGENIKTARESMGLKQEQLAELTGLSANHISKIERGKSSAKFKNMAEICRVLGISMDELARGQSDGKISNPEAFDIVMKKLMMDKLQEALDLLGKENETGSERIY